MMIGFALDDDKTGDEKPIIATNKIRDKIIFDTMSLLIIKPPFFIKIRSFISANSP